MIQIPKKFLSKKFTIPTAIILFLLLALFTVFSILNAITIKVGFFQVPENARISLQQEISSLNPKHVKFTVIPDEEELSPKAIRKYNLFFTENVKCLKDSNKKFYSLFDGLYNLIPDSLKAPSKELKAIPVLMDHFELGCYRTYRNFSELPVPVTYPDLIRYLQAMKNYADLPLFVAGQQDENFWGFISAMAEATGHYDSIIEEFPGTGEGSFSPAMEKTLKEIKELQKLHFIHPSWFLSNQKDLEIMMKDHRIGAFCSTLTFHRNLPLVLVKYYDASFFPPVDYSQPRGIIAPEILAAVPSYKNGAPKIIEGLLQAETQARLSLKSNIAPAASQGEAGDSTSDDVRFWAASCPKGALPSLDKMLFVSKKEQAKYAQYIRQYLAE